MAALTIAFGLMVSLARHVRSEAAHSLVQRELLELEDALGAYRSDHGQLPQVTPLFPDAAGLLVEDLAGNIEPSLRERALHQNVEFVRALGIGARRQEQVPGERRSALGGVSAMMFDGSRLLDPWGMPIAYLAQGRPEIGTAAGNAPFFLSAGPDGLYLTRDDNIYSYEVVAAGPEAVDQPARPPADGGASASQNQR